MAVHQFLPSLSRGDAIGNHVQRMRRVIQRYGPSEIYVESTNVPLGGVVKHFLDYEHLPGDTVIYHASIGTPMARYLLARDFPVVIDYHNVTPMHFFAGYEARIAALCYAGKLECRQFAERSPLGMADAEFSERELQASGFTRTATIPILTEFEKYDQPPNRRLLRRLEKTKRGSDILFVGRLAPNKRQEDVIKAFAVYKRHFDPGARLFLVGHKHSDRYLKTLHAFIDHLSLEDVHFAGAVPDAQLLSYYKIADAFLSMSEHEGFLVPLLECWLFEVPVVAFASTAVPETMGAGGILFHEKNYEEVGAILHTAITDAGLRDVLIRAGKDRLERFRPEPHEVRLGTLLDEVVQ